MSHSSTHNNNKNNTLNNKLQTIRDLCSFMLIKVVKKSGFIFKTNKTYRIFVWFTKRGVKLIEVKDSKGRLLTDYPFEIDFKENDNISKAISWVDENDYDIVNIINKGRGRRSKED